MPVQNYCSITFITLSADCEWTGVDVDVTSDGTDVTFAVEPATGSVTDGKFKATVAGKYTITGTDGEGGQKSATIMVLPSNLKGTWTGNNNGTETLTFDLDRFTLTNDSSVTDGDGGELIVNITAWDIKGSFSVSTPQGWNDDNVFKFVGTVSKNEGYNTGGVYLVATDNNFDAAANTATYYIAVNSSSLARTRAGLTAYVTGFSKK